MKYKSKVKMSKYLSKLTYRAAEQEAQGNFKKRIEAKKYQILLNIND